jgi:hypothetical protein
MSATTCAKPPAQPERHPGFRYQYTGDTTVQDDRTFGKTLLLLAFWAYVLIPLGAGIWSTLGKAMKLFS